MVIESGKAVVCHDVNLPHRERLALEKDLTLIKD